MPAFPEPFDAQVTIHDLMSRVTELGDIALLLPLAGVLVFIYWRYQYRSAALWLAGAIVLSAGLTVVLKLAFLTCADVWNAGIASPSGHTSMGTMVYGAAGLLAARHAPTRQRWVVLAATLALIALIGISRVEVGAHNTREVFAGFIVGAGACLGFALYYVRRPAPALNVPVVLAVLVAAMVAFVGLHADMEPVLRRASGWFPDWRHLCAPLT